MWPFSSSFPEARPEDVNGKTFDYVIVGGGTAGVVLASKLSEDPSVRVLLIERGVVSDTWSSRVPLISMNYTVDTSPVLWDHRSTPVAARGGYTLPILTAHVLGGASRINAALCTRGVPGGYNDWAESLGLTDWSWDKVEPYFKAIENAATSPNDPSRGHDGPMEMNAIPSPHDYMSHLEKPCRTLGLPISDDVNSLDTPAQSFSDMNMAISAKGVRLSAMSGFLNAQIANERRAHLTVCTGTVATKLQLNDTGKTVVGVQIRRDKKLAPGGSRDECFVKVRREAIVCGGSFVSPQLLMLSGIGPEKSLKKHGIHCAQDLPVGRTFKDHLLFGVQLSVPQRESILGMVNSTLVAIWQFMLYLIWGVGMLGNTTNPRCIFFRTSSLDEKSMVVKAEDADGNDTMDPMSPRNVADIEIMPCASSVMDRFLPGASIMTLLTCLTQPESVGTLELTSADVEDYVKVEYPYFTDPRDLVAARKSARFAMRLADEFINNSGYPHETSILTAPGVNRLPKGYGHSDIGLVPRITPVVEDPNAHPSATRTIPPRYEVEKTWDTVTDAEIDRYVLATGLVGNHGSCTCRMSLSPSDGVVDQQLKVHGMTNLRVADASVFPKLPSAHTMLPTMMVGARCADMIKSSWRTKA